LPLNGQLRTSKRRLRKQIVELLARPRCRRFNLMLFAPSIDAFHDQLVHGKEMAAPYFLLDQPLCIGFKLHRHTFKLAPSNPQRKLGPSGSDRFSQSQPQPTSISPIPTHYQIRSQSTEIPHLKLNSAHPCPPNEKSTPLRHQTNVRLHRKRLRRRPGYILRHPTKAPTIQNRLNQRPLIRGGCLGFQAHRSVGAIRISVSPPRNRAAALNRISVGINQPDLAEIQFANV
jgi:hypothetical protein